MSTKAILVRCRGADRVSIDALVPFQGDLKTLPDAAYEKLKTSIEKYGVTFPLFVWKNKKRLYTLDGHQRDVVLRRMRDDGYKIPAVPVDYIQARDRKEAKEKILLLSSQYGKITSEAFLGYIAESGIDLADLCPVLEIPSLDIAALMEQKMAPEAPEAQINRAEELQAKWAVGAGDLWIVGNHRLLCGDSTKPADVKRLLGGVTPVLMVTDPPYGVEYDPAWRNEAAEKGQLAYADRRIGEVAHDDRADWSAAWKLFPGDVAYTWSPGGDHVIITGNALIKSEYQIRNQIVWRKPHFPISRGHYTYQHEPCWYAVKRGRKAHWIGDKNASTVWDIALDKNVEGGHSTQKPLECMARPIRNHNGDVYDPFLGTGTTMVAAEILKRKSYGMEIEAKYCAVILERMSDMGLKPKRAKGK